MKKLSLLLIMLIMVSLVPAVAFAADASPWTTGKTYQEKMFGKLDYGFTNVIFGATHLISEPLHGIHDGGAMGGLNGLGSGLMHSVEYVGGGLLHLATFPITNLDVPLPDGGAKNPFKKTA